MGRLAAILLVVLVLVLPVLAEEDPASRLLTFDAELLIRATDRAGRPQGDVKRSAATVKLWLGPRWFAVARPNKVTRYDFSAFRVTKWSPTGPGSTSVSVDSQVDYRRLETYNRTRIGEVLEASGQQQSVFSQFAIETLLGVESEPGALRELITRTERDGEIIFSAAGREVVRVRPGKAVLPESCRDAFELFVRHRLRIHPIIREQILAMPNVPAAMVIRWINVGQQFEQTLSFKDVVADASGPPEPPPPAPPGKSLLDRDLFKARSAAVPSLKMVRRRMRMLEREEAWLGALLSLYEYAIATGDQPSAEIRGLIGRATETDQLRQLVSRLPELEDPARAGEFRTGLANLKDREPRFGHLIDIWRANASVTIGEPEVARDLLLAVLRERPELAGAWSDLGWIYHRSFKVDDAWRCFEAGLRLAPHHPMLASVVELRDSLRERYPQFYD